MPMLYSPKLLDSQNAEYKYGLIVYLFEAALFQCRWLICARRYFSVK